MPGRLRKDGIAWWPRPPKSTLPLLLVSCRCVAFLSAMMTSVVPFSMAAMSGLTPWPSTLLQSALASSRMFTISRLPAAAAIHSAVAPFLAPVEQGQSTSVSSLLSSIRPISTSPCAAARCSGVCPSSSHWLGSTLPCSSRYFTCLCSFMLTASCSAFMPFTLVAVTLMPALTSSVITSSQSDLPVEWVENPLDISTCAAVLPSAEAASGLAPAISSVRTTAAWRLAAAMCSGVRWSRVMASVLAPPSSREDTTASWPPSAATHSGVAPSMERASSLVRQRRAETTLWWPLQAAIQSGVVSLQSASALAPFSSRCSQISACPLHAAIHTAVAPPCVTTFLVPLSPLSAALLLLALEASSPISACPSSAPHSPSGFFVLPRFSSDSITAFMAELPLSSSSTVRRRMASFLKAPCASSSLTHSRCPLEAAIHRGVQPLLWALLGSALWLRSTRTTSECPIAAVLNRMLCPERFLNSTFAPLWHSASTIRGLLRVHASRSGVEPS
mmetsp:Transcript_14268/g.36602  ORF Transcript_14268/g.36602 Transcript_14268/m.36602 type:complete len:502 (+) Transcript_14268:142-1647(+)